MKSAALTDSRRPASKVSKAVPKCTTPVRIAI
jgi:hypothetical protein